MPAANRHNNHAKGFEKLAAHLSMLLFCGLIAGSFSLGGIATQYMQPAALQALRYLATCLLLAAICYGILRLPLRLPVQPARFLVLGVLMGVYMLTMFIALQFTSPVSTGAVFTLMPLMSAGFAWLLIGQRTRAGVLLSLVIAASGAIWVIFRGDVAALLRFDVGRGEMIYFIGVICHAVYVPLIRKFNRGEHPLVFGLWAAAGTFVFMIFPAAPQLLEVDFLDLPPVIWFTLAYLSIAATGVSFFLLQYASLRLPAPKVLAYGYLTPTVIIVIEGLIGHGWASGPVFIGALITAGGLLVMALLPD